MAKKNSIKILMATLGLAAFLAGCTMPGGSSGDNDVKPEAVVTQPASEKEEPAATAVPTEEIVAPTETVAPTNTVKPTATNTPTKKPTATNTPTKKPTATNTPTKKPTATNTPTKKPTATNTPTKKPTATNTPTNKPAQGNSGKLTGKTAAEIVADMGTGWNLGNTFDSNGGNLNDIYSLEKSWGNPVVTKTLIDGVAAAGFKTIRIPCTWYRAFSNKTNYTISEQYLARVKEVVDWAYANDMYVILNVHHEDWINNANLVSKKASIGYELKIVWTQIADYFADYDQHLIFEGLNEPRLAGTDIEWTGNQEAYDAVNYLTQIFAEVVRGSGKGYNNERCLMIPGYAASSSTTVMKAVKFPTINGKTVNNVIASVHGYAPYDFCLSTKKTFDGKGAIDSLFNGLNSVFLSKGIPVVLGETSATNNQNNTTEREKWAKYMGQKSKEYGVPLVLWDNGTDGKNDGECHAWMNRTSGEPNYPTVINALFAGYNGTEFVQQDNTTQTSSFTNGTVMWKSSKGVSNDGANWTEFIQVESDPSYFKNTQIAVMYKGSGSVLVVMDSEKKESWWVPIEKYTRGTKDGYNVLYLKVSDILDLCKKASPAITDAADFRYLNVVCTSGNITVYEVSAIK